MRPLASADFAAHTKVTGMDELAVRAYAISRCITAATDDKSLYSLKVAEVGALCVAQLGWLP